MLKLGSAVTHLSKLFPQKRFIMSAISSSINKMYEDIHKSEGDSRLYRGLELKNGLKVMLVSDSTTDRSAAAMDVNIGHMSDPKQLPGLAHFCEHMLFLGTKKYQEENSYTKYLTEHSGTSNAYTSAEHTNYFFDIAPEHLGGALDRFFQFFLCPLFTESATEREINAVNSENDKNLQSDMWRLHQLEKACGNVNHDFSKFGTGNIETLKKIPEKEGISVREALMEFHKRFYSANIMSFALLAKESLDEMQDMVVGHLSGIENKHVTVSEWPEHPYGPDQLCREVHVVPVKDLRSLHLMWPIEDLQKHYRSSPASYLSHLLGHEGPGSLLSELKARGWVSHLMGGHKQGARGFMFFVLNVDLSTEGIEHTDEIIELCYRYINMLKKEGTKEWIFRECQLLYDMQFRFKDKERPQSYVSSLAGAIPYYPLEDVLSGGRLLHEFKPEIIDGILERLKPDNMTSTIVAKKFQGKTCLTEKWYCTEYSLTKISTDKLKKWDAAVPSDQFQLPPPNPFIAEKFDLQEREPSALPLLIKSNEFSKLWFQQDNKFLLPKALITLQFTNPLAYSNPSQANLSNLFVSCFQDSLNEFAYAAELAGFSYSLEAAKNNIIFKLNGYNDKLSILLEEIIKKMAVFKPDEGRFGILRENYVRGLQNFFADQPHQHAIYYTNWLMSEEMWTKKEKLDVIEECTYENLQLFIPLLLSHFSVEALIYGNCTRKQADSWLSIAERILKESCSCKPLLPSQCKRFREVQLQPGCNCVYVQHNEVHKSSAVELILQCKIENTRDNMLLELAAQIMHEPCYQQLRTEEQLGYIVFSGVRHSHGIQSLRIIIQSDKDPASVELRISSFLETMLENLEKMDAETFSNHVNALSCSRLEKPKKMSSQHAIYWSEISSKQYHFDRDNVEVACLKTLTKEDVIAFYKEYLRGENRRKYTSHVIGTDHKDQQIPKGVQVIEDVLSFKQSLPLFPTAPPYYKFTENGKSKL